MPMAIVQPLQLTAPYHGMVTTGPSVGGRATDQPWSCLVLWCQQDDSVLSEGYSQ